MVVSFIRTARWFTVAACACAIVVLSVTPSIADDAYANLLVLPEALPPPEASPPPAITPTPAEVKEELPAPSLDLNAGIPVEDDWVLSDDALMGTEHWYGSFDWIDPEPWDVGVELGLNGSTGTSEAFSIRTGGYVKLDSRFSKLDFSTYYNRTSAGGETTQNNSQTDVRNDWLLDESSPWTLFALGSLFYDEFKDFDLQTNGNSGFGYQFADFPDLNLTGRIGAGASREFGGVDDEWKPEALFGFDYEQTITKSQKFACKVEYYPEFEDFNRYRVIADAGYEIALDRPSNLSVKFSVNDRYDSTPNGSEPHLVNYSALLLLKL